MSPRPRPLYPPHLSSDPFSDNMISGYESVDDINPFSPRKPSIKRDFCNEALAMESTYMNITPPKSSSSDFLPSLAQLNNGNLSQFPIPTPSPQTFKTPLKLVKPDPNVFSHSGYKSKKNRHTTTPSALKFRVKAKFSPLLKDTQNYCSSQSIEDSDLLHPSITPRTPSKKSNTKFVFMSETGPSTSPIRQPLYDSFNDVQTLPFSEQDYLMNFECIDAPSSPRRLVFEVGSIDRKDSAFSSSDSDIEDVEHRSDINLSPFRQNGNVFNNSLFERKVSEWMSPKANFFDSSNFSHHIAPAHADDNTSHTNEDYFLSKFDILESIGSGSFAEVYKVCKVDDESSISCVKKSKSPYSGNLDRYAHTSHHPCRRMKLEEILALWAISGHPNCIQILSAWEQSGILYIETEFCPNGR